MNFANLSVLVGFCFCTINRLEKFHHYHARNDQITNSGTSRARTQRDLIGQNRLGNTVNSHLSHSRHTQNALSVRGQVLQYLVTSTATQNIDKRSIKKLVSKQRIGGRRPRKLQFRHFMKHHVA